MKSRYLSDEDKKLVRDILKGDMKFGIVFLIIFLAILGLMLFAGIKGTSTASFFDLAKIGAVAIFALFVCVKFMFLDKVQLLRRLEEGDYTLSSYEVIRCWEKKIRCRDGNKYKYYIEMYPLGPDGVSAVAIKETLDTGNYFRAKGYKYVHKIHFGEKNSKVTKYNNGVVVDSTQLGYSCIYKGTNIV